jgi:dipeptidyl-peptidase-4
MVRNSWWGKSFLWYNLLAQQGYIIFSVDNRGTGGRGKAWTNLSYGDLGRWAVHDHIEAAKYLAGLSFVDKNRIGIRGWSFGGYLTLLAMTKGAEYFAAGVAGAPVTDWRLYDNIYTERYMGLPAENKAGYDSSSVFPYLDRLQGKLLIIHGMADDNVHAQNTMQVAEKLQKIGKQFDLMVYPGQDHSVRDRKTKIEFQLYSLMTRYILVNL